MPKSVQFTPNVLMHHFEGEAVILNLENETYYSLNGIAVRIWELLKATASVEQTLKKMLEEYDVDEPVLRRDLESFVDTLQKASLIQVVES